VGHSCGGQVALDFALLAPQRVRTLTVMCSRDTAFPPIAAAAARLRSGNPVDIGTALSRWFTPPELSADGPGAAACGSPPPSTLARRRHQL
jgi:pimeloyl-ACP methyl ester carboxylesterase